MILRDGFFTLNEERQLKALDLFLPSITQCISVYVNFAFMLLNACLIQQNTT
jgi:hypothetical protein